MAALTTGLLRLSPTFQPPVILPLLSSFALPLDSRQGVKEGVFKLGLLW